MGRRKLDADEARSVVVKIRLNAKEDAKLEQLRGERPRSAWFRRKLSNARIPKPVDDV